MPCPGYLPDKILHLGEQPYENLFQDYQQLQHFLLPQSAHIQYENQYNLLRPILKCYSVVSPFFFVFMIIKLLCRHTYEFLILHRNHFQISYPSLFDSWTPDNWEQMPVWFLQILLHVLCTLFSKYPRHNANGGAHSDVAHRDMYIHLKVFKEESRILSLWSEIVKNYSFLVHLLPLLTLIFAYKV